VLKIIYRIFLYLFFSSLLYVVILKFVNPPITATQITNAFGLGLHRDYVNWDEMSNTIKLAALASEDQSFTDHSGFDWDAIEKSLRPKKKKKKSKIPLGGGASTITQQTAKNVFLWQGSGWDRYLRKIPEFYFTFLIELVWGKQRILEVYLNVIETGPGCFGVEAAAQHFFHRSAKNLTREQAAMIVAGFPNPKKFTAVPMTGRVAWRYPQILREMNNIQADEDVIELLKNK
jgi:monofunctional biosynthetic peptidoglycan transglycosylase